MNIFLCGSNQLTALDQEEIKKFLTDYAHKHKIYILCYKSIENEILRFFIENERLAQNLCLYTLQPLQALTDEFQEVVDYLKNTEPSMSLLIILPTPFTDQIICFCKTNN